MPTELWQRLREARRRSQLTQQNVADACGIDRAAVSQWEARDQSKRTTPSQDNLKAFQALTKAPWGWLLSDASDLDEQWDLNIIEGRDYPEDDEHEPHWVREEPQKGYLRPISVWDDPSDLDPDEYVFLPSLEYRLSCGPGGPDPDAVERTDRTTPFRAGWANAEGWRPSTHYTMRAQGDSMEPTIQDGAPVVIDTSTAGKTVRSGRIYAILVNGEPLLKRLDKLPSGRLRVRSDNPSIAYQPFEVDETALHIIGRAVWTPVRL